MRLTTFASTLSLFCSSTFAHPHANVNHLRTLEERQAGVTTVNGASGNAVYPRLEIRQLYNTNPHQWTLFIQAMQSWKAESQSSATSYFGVAAIHGVPRQNYNNVPQCSSCQNTDGYCPHNSVLFPAWHRTYMAMFEEQFLQRVNAIANSYNGSPKSTMLDAAATMRFPYWDWAAHPSPGEPTLPAVISAPDLTINATSGPQTIANPLYQYSYTDSSGMYYGPFNNWPETLRYPNNNDQNTYSVESNATSAFDNIRQSLQDQVYQLFTACTDYLHFSNDAAGSSSTSCSNSLEGIHNTIHMTSGGQGGNGISGGHMTYLPLAAFDPIFWLHHANVDRLFAMWQTINPGSYGGSQAAPGATWTVAQGSTQDADSNLTPFYKDNSGNFWTTNSVQNWNTTFHYTYPEFVNSDGDRAAIISYVNKLYGPGATATAGSSKRDAAFHPFASKMIASSAPATQMRDNPLSASNGSTYQYVANIQTPRYYLNGSYNIFLFQGQPATEDPMSWIHDPALIGPMGVLAETGPTQMQDLIVSGSVPLTRTLTNHVNSGLLANLAEELVAPFLQANLVWRVAGPNGQCVDPGSIPGFAISVVASTASAPTDECELPTYSPFTTLVSITQGLSGGLNQSTNLLGDTFKAVVGDVIGAL